MTKVVTAYGELPPDTPDEDRRMNEYFERMIAAFTDKERDDPMLHLAALSAFVLFAKCANPNGNPSALATYAEAAIPELWKKFRLAQEH